VQDEHTNVQKQEKIPERTLSRTQTPEHEFKLLTLFIMKHHIQQLINVTQSQVVLLKEREQQLLIKFSRTDDHTTQLDYAKIRASRRAYEAMIRELKLLVKIAEMKEAEENASGVW